MKYILGLGFRCKVYMYEPLARIYFNERFIDEFNIPHNHDGSKDIEWGIELEENFLPNAEPDTLNDANWPILKTRPNSKINSNPNIYWYEIETYPNEKNGNLKIEIHNSVSNYSNAFMTKSTLLKLETLFILPAHIIKNKLIEEYRLRHTKHWFLYNPYIQNLEKYGKDPNPSFIKKLYMQHNYRIKFPSLIKHTNWTGNNGLKVNLPNDLYHSIGNYLIGGEGYFNCDLIKKYGCWLPNKHVYKTPLRLDNELIHEVLIPLQNKYKSYENQ